MALSIPSDVRAETTIVSLPATANGHFGAPANQVSLVAGKVFTAAGQKVEITASGLINLMSGNAIYTVGPDGGSFTRQPFIGGILGNVVFPLEEALFDDGDPANDPEFANGSAPVSNVGAVFGAFVPLSVTTDPGFLPLNEDPVVLNASPPASGIPSDAIFLIGAGPHEFTAPGPGTLYLGINEPFVTNNIGAFSVEVLDLPPAGQFIITKLADDQTTMPGTADTKFQQFAPPPRTAGPQRSGARVHLAVGSTMIASVPSTSIRILLPLTPRPKSHVFRI